MNNQEETLSEFKSQPEAKEPINGIVVGRVLTVCERGKAWIKHSVYGSETVLLARSTVSIETKDLGREVVLMFDGGDSSRPIIMGVLQRCPPSNNNSLLDEILYSTESSVDVKADEERLTVTASKEIVIQCGKASITLTRAGKVLIRGAYVSSRSSGVNKIKGGSVQIN